MSSKLKFKEVRLSVESRAVKYQPDDVQEAQPFEARLTPEILEQASLNVQRVKRPRPDRLALTWRRFRDGELKGTILLVFIIGVIVLVVAKKVMTVLSGPAGGG